MSRLESAMRTTGSVLMLIGFVLLGFVGFFPPVRSITININPQAAVSSAFATSESPPFRSPILNRSVLIMGTKSGDFIDTTHLLAEAMIAVAMAGVGWTLRSMAATSGRSEQY
jgi:hypothetical protein